MKAPVNFKRERRCVALTGGVGGAKLCLGLSHVLESDQLVVVANTADDFEHYGLHVSPDLDTVLYTLAGVANAETGWGRAGESWHFLEALDELGGETWFRLGDRDLATHLERTRRLRQGHTLSEVTTEFCLRLGVSAAIVPMSDDPVRTIVDSDEGALPFQRWFVQRRCEPAVRSLFFDGAEEAAMSHGMQVGLHDPQLGAIVICPSNPLISVDPILRLRGASEVIRACPAPVIAVSPIVRGQAIKGPAAKMMQEMGMPVSAGGVARFYHERGLLDGFVLDRQDAELADDIESLGVPVMMTNTVMLTLDDRIELAREVLDFAAGL
jgi:LPPG:FO 2-phospho-L-lactate transferase